MYFTYETKLGKLTIVADDHFVSAICFGEICKGEKKEGALIKETYKQLSEYLQGRRQKFDLPLAANGTAFQKKVWASLQEIPYGGVCSYKDIAIAIGNEKAVRAVGMANNKNPLPIIVPCHRVIGSNGKMVGYAGGLNIKSALLELEKSSLEAID